MPYSHLHRLAKEKLESSTHCLGDLASLDRPDSDFSELVWENGQILMQGQSNKSRKSSGVTLQRKEEEHLPPSFKPTHSVLSDFPSSVPSSRHMGMGQDDELVHWLNYPLDDYSSEFFSEFNQNAFSMQNTAVPVLKNNGSGGANSEQGNMAKLVREGPEITRIKGSQQGSSPRVQNFQESLPSHRSRVQDSTGCDTNNAQQVRAGHLTQNQPSTSRPPKSKVQQQEPEPTQPSSNTGFMNFSHFLRPATSVKTNLQSGDGALGSSSSGRDRFRTNDKVSVVSGSNHMQSTLIESASGSRSLTGYENKQNSLAAKMELKPALGKPPKEPFCTEQSQPDCREDALGKGRSPDQAFGQTSSFAASAAAGGTDNEKCVEPVVASSSVCSGSSAKEASNDVKHRFKRKFRDTEESDYPSEDVEEESVGLRKPTSARGGTSIKRSRAAEVHNLSERKRRDRINEKMRALQELIPNCNKVDKASMLDEAIEYLKTLQLQVQIMSMGTGLFMPPMMLPNGMQHMSAPHLPPYASMNAGMGLGMGLGMGMGMGFGMGMLDMNGGSSGYPLMQVPPMHGGHFSYPPISAPPSLPMMPGSSLPMFGTAGQGIPMQTPCAPSVPLSGPLSKCAPSPVVPGAAIPVEVPNLAVPSSSKDPTEDINIQLPKRVADCSENPMASQVTKEGADQSAAEQRHDQDQPSQSGGNGVMDST